MRRACIAALAVLTSMLVVTPAHASVGRVPPSARFRGHDLVEWQRIDERWALGGPVSDLFESDCGAIVGGVLFVTPGIFGVTKMACEIPAGTPILIQAGAAVSEIPTYADTRAEARADVRARWSLITGTTVSVDGTGIPVDGAYREAGVYPIRFVQGSQLSFNCAILAPPCVLDNTPPGPALVATVGTFVMLRPLPPGDHHLDVSTDFQDHSLDVFAEIRVG